jgi:putative acetyltransferase
VKGKQRLTIRAEQPDDVEDVRRVVASAFGGQRMAGLLDGLRDSVAWLDLGFVAVERDTVVGAVFFSRAWLDSPTRLVEVLVLSPMAVLLDRQRSGVGSQLLDEAMEAVRDRDEPLVFLEGDPGFYSRLGFVAGKDLGFTAPSVRIPDHAFQVATLPGYDQATMSGAVVYPDIFWRHDCVGLRPEV